MPDNTNKAAVLVEIGTELIVNELKRRAVAKGMTVEELVAEAQAQWQNAEDAADELAGEGHDQQP
jgi:hypothetical protein